MHVLRKDEDRVKISMDEQEHATRAADQSECHLRRFDFFTPSKPLRTGRGGDAQGAFCCKN
jgi:hypothetical protein